MTHKSHFSSGKYYVPCPFCNNDRELMENSYYMGQKLQCYVCSKDMEVISVHGDKDIVVSSTGGENPAKPDITTGIF